MECPEDRRSVTDIDMRKSSQPRSLGDLMPLSHEPELATSDLASARSITLMIHGVGNTTDQRLLTAAANGYYESGLGVISERLTLSECPNLFGKNGAESMVFQGSGGPHFLVALPWAQPGLSGIALGLAVVLLALAALATATFEFRDTIDELRNWLRPLSYRLVAYLIIMALSYFAYLLNPHKAKGEFRPPSVFIVILPLVLLLGLEYFVEATWLWIPFALLAVTLWLMWTWIVMRCLSMAPTLRWRLALATLIVALALPASALVFVAWRFAGRYSDAQFVSKLSVVVICVALCLLLWFFSWLLDFGLDMLNYVGHEKLRAFLIDGTTNTIKWFHDRAPDTPIAVTHSVIASHAISSLSALEPCLRQIVLVTLGSPLNYLNRAFPESVQGSRGLSQAICARVRWINLWRRYDLVGKALNIETTGTLQYCVGSGGHPNYWSDGAVWRAVAREALGVSDGTERQVLSTRGTCLFERWLGPLVFAAITVIALCGAGLWVITL